MNKRVVSVFLLVLVLASLLINVGFVSADSEKDFNTEEITKGTQELGTEVSETLAPILRFLFNIKAEKDAEGNLVTEKGITQSLLSFIFAFVIVFVFLLLASKNIPGAEEHPALSKVIIIVASLLGIRGIAQLDVMDQIFMPYSVAALAVINGAIFIGWFVLVNIGMENQRFKFARRFLWILFAVTFIGVWYIRKDDIGGLLTWIYIGTIILAFILALLDGSIQGFRAKMAAERLENINKVELRAKLKQKIKDYEQMVQDGSLDDKELPILKRKIQAQAKAFGIKKLI